MARGMGVYVEHGIAQFVEFVNQCVEYLWRIRIRYVVAIMSVRFWSISFFFWLANFKNSLSYLVIEHRLVSSIVAVFIDFTKSSKSNANYNNVLIISLSDCRTAVGWRRRRPRASPSRSPPPPEYRNYSFVVLFIVSRSK